MPKNIIIENGSVDFEGKKIEKNPNKNRKILIKIGEAIKLPLSTGFYRISWIEAL